MRSSQRIVLRRRMHQRIDMIPHQRDETHDSACSRNPTDRAPLVSGSDPTERPLKRTLRLVTFRASSNAQHTVFSPSTQAVLGRMVKFLLRNRAW
jgi:hypothetical protein